MLRSLKEENRNEMVTGAQKPIISCGRRKAKSVKVEERIQKFRIVEGEEKGRKPNHRGNVQPTLRESVSNETHKCRRGAKVDENLSERRQTSRSFNKLYKRREGKGPTFSYKALQDTKPKPEPKERKEEEIYLGGGEMKSNPKNIARGVGQNLKSVEGERELTSQIGRRRCRGKPVQLDDSLKLKIHPKKEGGEMRRGEGGCECKTYCRNQLVYIILNLKWGRRRIEIRKYNLEEDGEIRKGGVGARESLNPSVKR